MLIIKKKNFIYVLIYIKKFQKQTQLDKLVEKKEYAKNERFFHVESKLL